MRAACVILLFLLTATLPAQSWQPLTPATSPTPRLHAPAAYDPFRGVTTLFGGDGACTALNDTWEFTGATWTPRLSVVRPSARAGHGFAFDLRRQRAVLFGGLRPGLGVAGDTWEWDGSTWLQRTPATAPPARAFAAMAYDATRGVTVLFGGEGSGGALLGDTWEWDGATWQLRALATAPTARRHAAMAGDEVRRDVVLFGGDDGAQALGDTWTFDGAQWQAKAPPQAPGARQQAALAGDGNFGRLVLLGGLHNGSALADAWAWDGSAWSPLAGAVPPARRGHALAFDAQRGATVCFGGSDTAACSGARADTWELASPAVRQMTVVAPPVVGQTAQFRYDYPAAAGANHFYWHLVTLRQPAAFAVPIPGFPSLGLCRVDLFNLLGDVTGFLDGSGQNVLSLAVPNQPAAAGFGFDVQTVDLDFWTMTLRWAGNDVEATVGWPAPTASFVATPTSGAAPLVVSFVNNSTNATGFAWDFGDGTSSNAATPPAKVYVGGNYTVSLTASGPGGVAVAQQQVVVTGANAAPVASFTATPTSGNAPLVVQFTDTSTQFPTSWQWDFNNDGTIDSTQQNPSWTYTSNGVYSVRLVATNFVGSGAVTRSNLVFVGPLLPNPLLNMVPIAPGTFQMGQVGMIFAVAEPVHQVMLSHPFWMGKYEVTQAEYQAVVGSNPSYFQGVNAPNAPQRPVEQVSWNSAVAYCQALTATEQAAGRVPAGYQYRLPTEAEWEYCCRAGTTTEWNTGTSLNTSQANFGGALANATYTAGQTAVVGSYAPNAFGLHDMHGNVWEWCLDSFAMYAPGPVTDPFVPFVGGGGFPVIRGGGWSSINLGSAYVCQSAFRWRSQYGAPGDGVDIIGFRVVLAPVLVP